MGFKAPLKHWPVSAAQLLRGRVVGGANIPGQVIAACLASHTRRIDFGRRQTTRGRREGDQKGIHPRHRRRGLRIVRECKIDRALLSAQSFRKKQDVGIHRGLGIRTGGAKHHEHRDRDTADHPKLSDAALSGSSSSKQRW
jgi:hypothetical protein